ETISRISAQIERLAREETEGRDQVTTLEEQLIGARGEYAGRQSGFGVLRVQLVDAADAGFRNKEEHGNAVKRPTEPRTHEEIHHHRLQTIGEPAAQRAYTTESVQQFFNADPGHGCRPLGTLPDSVDAQPEYEALVEDSLRSNLQYVLVEDRTA